MQSKTPSLAPGFTLFPNLKPPQNPLLPPNLRLDSHLLSLRLVPRFSETPQHCEKRLGTLGSIKFYLNRHRMGTVQRSGRNPSARGLLTIVFGFGYWFDVHLLGYFIGVQVFCGVFQSIGWPCVVAVVGNWFGKRREG
ncbi:hypothetical protein F3Y22_tig00000340pilonHSYRG00370 [Hibiscus syriacus]|uniref:Uncharacterized protein n=1 Tax=Hibiscus syriacus TaxID=106335 RepID=A0A6A3D1T7_HIBSY|nr:hypothetical protein F3Y22_tig00000340pilonHSYRG00370 [Hibiscus syriacus]